MRAVISICIQFDFPLLYKVVVCVFNCVFVSLVSDQCSRQVEPEEGQTPHLEVLPSELSPGFLCPETKDKVTRKSFKRGRFHLN